MIINFLVETILLQVTHYIVRWKYEHIKRLAFWTLGYSPRWSTWWRKWTTRL